MTELIPLEHESWISWIVEIENSNWSQPASWTESAKRISWPTNWPETATQADQNNFQRHEPDSSTYNQPELKKNQSANQSEIWKWNKLYFNAIMKRNL